MGSFPGAAGGDRAKIKGHYRLLDQPDDSAVTFENILLPHREQTLRRMCGWSPASGGRSPTADTD